MRYAGADLPLFLTHGPVRLAITGRTLSGGSAAGVAMGEAFSPPLTIFALLRPAASAFFLTMGTLLNRQAGHSTAADRRLTRPGTPAGFFDGMTAHRHPTDFPFHMSLLPASSSSAALGTSTSPSSWRSGPLRLSRQPGSRAFHRSDTGWLTSPRASRQINRRPSAIPIAAGRIIPLA
ncbi:hypothetical protein M2324_003004 [Rhodovulum sulfidophilum]|uniref:hypothetical protein n=1 Tax=Rhodovulum sulfidophilum TaxID=35806 RepID=UPI0012DA3C6F|nr:hypothetical protein [Rhodovulum sulfidophilum]MCW2304593.1 hypothetical protein [Rhodovulum sulfidophilum]